MKQYKMGTYMKMEHIVKIIEDMEKIDANAIMLYLGNPQRYSYSGPSIRNCKLMKREFSHKDIMNICIHAPFIINLASGDEQIYNNSLRTLIQQIRYTYLIGASDIIVHPGAFTKYTYEEGIRNLAKALNSEELIEQLEKYPINISLETMAGLGTQIGVDLIEFKEIFSQLSENIKKYIKVCIDICHMHDAGWNIKNNEDETINYIDEVIGLENVNIFHISDSLNRCGSRCDRHANFASTIMDEYSVGYLGNETIHKIVNNSQLAEKIFILETPYHNLDEIKNQIYFLKNTLEYSEGSI